MTPLCLDVSDDGGRGTANDEMPLLGRIYIGDDEACSCSRNTGAFFGDERDEQDCDLFRSAPEDS